jgi:anti-sigma regulatory factor (Ser/Thr protein kinase)
VLAITSPHRAHLLRAALGGDAAGVEFADNADWFRVPGWVFAEYHRFLRQRPGDGGRLWLLSEPAWGGWDADQAAEWQRCESLINVAFGWAPAAVICAYDSRALPAPIIADATASHPALVAGERAIGSARYVQPAEYTAAHRLDVPPAPETADALMFDLGDLATVRSVATSWATRETLPPDRVRDLLIAVHEIASNAIEHGGGAGLIRFWASERELICEVSSAAPLRQPYPGYLPPDTGQERGRGLWMARQICSRVDIVAHHGDGVNVRITMPRSQ